MNPQSKKARKEGKEDREEEEGSDGTCPQHEQRTERWGEDREKKKEEVWSRNKQQQKVGREPPAAGDPDRKQEKVEEIEAKILLT